MVYTHTNILSECLCIISTCLYYQSIWNDWNIPRGNMQTTSKLKSHNSFTTFSRTLCNLFIRIVWHNAMKCINSREFLKWNFLKFLHKKTNFNKIKTKIHHLPKIHCIHIHLQNGLPNQRSCFLILHEAPRNIRINSFS